MNRSEIDTIIQLAWDDLTSFEEIEAKTGLTEAEVITLMRRELKRSSFRRWRTRVSGRPAKHRKLLEHRKLAANRRTHGQWLRESLDH